MCWWIKVSVPLMYNLSVRLTDSVVDFFCGLVHCLTDVVTETNDTVQSEESDSNADDVHEIAVDAQKPSIDVHKNFTDTHKPPINVHKFTPDDHKTKIDVHKTTEKRKTNMADRPLPVPVENEPYYMDIERSEAENLLKGQPDGTFVLRPSSQPNHAYTLTVACSNAVHNVGVRRRPDGRLALGYARRGERCFTNVPSLLRHHKKRRLLLVSGGCVCGATTLNETPQYYQTPNNMPIM